MNIGILGLTHDHVWSNLRELSRLGDARILAAADPNEPLRARAQAETGCAVHADYEAVLNLPDLEAVYIFANNRLGAELAEEAARRKLHILIEKPLAADLAGADAVMRAVTENGVRLMVNWPFAWWPQLRHALRLAKSGAIGRVWQVKYRAAHKGPQEIGCSPYFYDWLYDEHLNGGGALLDYCGYGAMLARDLLGVPESVFGMQGNLCKKDLPVEDNAVLILRYPDAMATLEGSWTQIGKLTAYTTVIYGEDGTLIVEPREGPDLRLASDSHPDGELLHAPEIEPHLAHASTHFLWGIRTGEPFHALCDPALSWDAQLIMERGRESARTHGEVPVYS